MNRCAVHGVRRLTHRLRHRRMRVNGADEFFDGGFQAQRNAGLRHKLRGARTNHVDAEQLVVFLLGHDLHEAFGFVGDLCAAEDAEREDADAHVIAAGDGFLLCEADAADLRIAVGAERDVIVVDGRHVVPGDAFRQQDAFG